MKNTITQSPSPRRWFTQGAIDALPLVLAAAPVGALYAAIASANGLSDAATLAMSWVVFAGSAQFIAASLAGTDVSVWVVILTVFVVNLRHLLYSTSLMPHVADTPQRWRAPLAFVLTDEAFATTIGHLNRHGKNGLVPYYLGAALCLYLLWQVATLLGLVAGELFPQMNDWGLEVAMVVAFTGVVVASIKDLAGWACALTAITGMLLTFEWPNQLGLLCSSMLAIAVGVLIKRRSQV